MFPNGMSRAKQGWVTLAFPGKSTYTREDTRVAYQLGNAYFVVNIFWLYSGILEGKRCDEVFVVVFIQFQAHDLRVMKEVLSILIHLSVKCEFANSKEIVFYNRKRCQNEKKLRNLNFRLIFSIQFSIFYETLESLDDSS